MEVLKELRNQKKISQSKLADDLHVTQATVSRWETGEMLPTIDILNDLAKYFAVSVDYLLGRTKDSNKELCVPFSNIREFFGMSVKEMAEFLGRDASDVYEWEQNIKIPDQESLEKIANKLNTTVDVLTGKSSKDTISIDENGNLQFTTYGEQFFIKLKIDEHGNVVYADKKQKIKPVSEEDRLREENNELFDQLPKDKKQEALNYLRFLVEHQGKE